MLYFLIGSYVTGCAFTYWMSKSGFDIDPEPEWKKNLASIGIALAWPVCVAITVVMLVKETVWR